MEAVLARVTWSLWTIASMGGRATEDTCSSLGQARCVVQTWAAAAYQDPSLPIVALAGSLAWVGSLAVEGREG